MAKRYKIEALFVNGAPSWGQAVGECGTLDEALLWACAAMGDERYRAVMIRERDADPPPPGPQNPPSADVLMRADRDGAGAWRWSRATRYVA